MLCQYNYIYYGLTSSSQQERIGIQYSKRLLRTIQAGGGKSRLQQKRYLSRLSSCKAQCSKPTKKLQKNYEFTFLIIEYFAGNDNQQYPKNIFFKKTKYWLSCMRGEKSRFKKNNFSCTFSDFTAHCKPLRSPCLPMTSMMLLNSHLPSVRPFLKHKE